MLFQDCVCAWVLFGRVNQPLQVTFLQRLVDLSSETDNDGAIAVTFSLPLLQVNYDYLPCVCSRTVGRK